MTILYCATFNLDGTPVALQECIMVYGPRKLLEAVSYLVEVTFEHPYYKEILAQPNNKLSLRNIVGVIVDSKEHLTKEEQVYLREYFCLLFRRECAKRVATPKERLVI